jgi:precorrin-2 dehydrogenase/sirohydrochlorin ferrochelatase
LAAENETKPACEEVIFLTAIIFLSFVSSFKIDVAIRQRYKYNNTAMAKYPIFLELAGRRAVVVGGGAVAVRKAQVLLAAGARLIIVAEQVDDMLTSLCSGTDAKLVRSRYSKNYLTGAVLAIAATNNRQLNGQIYKDCQELEILCNVVDAPELCDFFVPAVVKRGDLQIAIGTEGYCPAYAGHLRKKLERTFTEKHGEFLAGLETLRKRIIKDVPDPADRKGLLGRLVDDKSFEIFVEHGPAEWQAYADRLISEKKA